MERVGYAYGGKALSDVGLQMQVQVQRMAHDTEDGHDKSYTSNGDGQ